MRVVWSAVATPAANPGAERSRRWTLSSRRMAVQVLSTDIQLPVDHQ